jgi:hypothetical protein
MVDTVNYLTIKSVMTTAARPVKETAQWKNDYLYLTQQRKA